MLAAAVVAVFVFVVVTLLVLVVVVAVGCLWLQSCSAFVVFALCWRKISSRDTGVYSVDSIAPGFEIGCMGGLLLRGVVCYLGWMGCYLGCMGRLLRV